ncbi:MAG: ABC transporter substrate-binding protein [Beijerinckiaceae bacterium]
MTEKTSVLHKCIAALSTAVAFMGFALGPVQAQDIKIGALLSVTGPASFLGDPADKTLKIYIDEINAKGGIKGRKIQLITYDDGGDANKARTFATRLVEEDKVVAVLGPSTTGTTMATVPVFEEAQIPVISFAGAVVVIEPVKKFIFKTPHTDRMACEKIFEDLKKRNLTKIGMISGTDGFGKSMRDECIKVNAFFGIEVVGEETYGPRDTDMTPQLTNLRGKAGLQAVINPGFGQGPAIVTRNFRQLGINVPLYQSHGVGSKQFIDLAGDAANGVRLPAAALLVADKLSASDPQKAIAVAYKKRYEDTTKQPVSTFGGHAYDGLIILVDAIERAATPDARSIRDEIEKTKGLIGTAGIFNMSATDHMGLTLAAFKMLEIKNGDWTLAE